MHCSQLTFHVVPKGQWRDVSVPCLRLIHSVAAAEALVGQQALLAVSPSGCDLIQDPFMHSSNACTALLRIILPRVYINGLQRLAVRTDVASQTTAVQMAKSAGAYYCGWLVYSWLATVAIDWAI